MGIFDPDGWFNKWGSKLFDLLMISIVTLVLILSSFTVLAGSSLSAFFYTIDKVIIHERGYLFKNYFKSFKENFKQATIFWLLLLSIYSGGAMSIYLLNQTNKGGILLIASYFIFIEALIVTCYGFVLLAKFQMTLKDIIGKSLLYGHRHLLTTLSIISLVIIMGFLTVKIHPIFIVLGFGITGIVISRLLLEVVLPKYIDKEKLIEFNE